MYLWAKYPNSCSKMQKQAEKGHIYFKDGIALNQDGSIYDKRNGMPEFSKKVSQ